MTNCECSVGAGAWLTEVEDAAEHVVYILLYHNSYTIRMYYYYYNYVADDDVYEVNPWSVCNAAGRL